MATLIRGICNVKARDVYAFSSDSFFSKLGIQDNREFRDKAKIKKLYLTLRLKQTMILLQH